MTLPRRIALAVLALGWIPTLAIVSVHWTSDTHALAQERTPIKFTRIYTGDDGKTHAEEMEPSLTRTHSFTEMSEPIDNTSLHFRRTSPEYFIDWHPAPRKQFVITLSGTSEIVIGDGSTVTLGPGHILLAEDTTGQGHISRAVGDDDRISIFLPLVDQD